MYKTFAEMLATENAGHIVPDDPVGALNVLQRIYPREKEQLGVYVLELKVVKGTSGR